MGESVVLTVPSRPRVVPVLDVYRGEVVHAVAGRRSEYRPISSCLVASTDPVAVACALSQHVGTREIYLADLDAILGGPRRLDLIAELSRRGFHVWLDAGLRFADEAKSLFAAGAAVVIAGLESVEAFEDLAILGVDFGERIAVSLDLRDGQPVVRDARRRGRSAEWLAFELAADYGVPRMILLDLARVGLGEGTGTMGLCRQLRGAFPGLQLVVGGGVRGPADLPTLAASGADAVLVATALHRGRFAPNPAAGGSSP